MRITDIKEIVGEFDGVKFSHSSQDYEGYVKEVNDTDIHVRAYKTFNGHGYNRNSYSTYILPYITFKNINIEWFFEGQGCDNSSIGCSGHWVKDLQEVTI